MTKDTPGPQGSTDQLTGFARPLSRWGRSYRGGYLALAPGVEGVVHEPPAFQQPLVVGLDVQSAGPDRQQPRTGRVSIEVGGDVSSVHNLGEAHQRGVAAQVIVLDQDLEGAFAVGWV